MLAANLPHKLRDRSTHCFYLRALLRLSEGPCGACVADGVLAMLVEHLVSQQSQFGAPGVCGVL